MDSITMGSQRVRHNWATFSFTFIIKTFNKSYVEEIYLNTWNIIYDKPTADIVNSKHLEELLQDQEKSKVAHSQKSNSA